MNWKITSYNQKVKTETLNSPSSILANFLHIVEIIEKLGPNLSKPYVGSIGLGLYEIRSKGKEGIGRSLYCIVKD